MNDLSVIYCVIVILKFRIEKMLNFYNLIGSGLDKNIIFIIFGRLELWLLNENEVGFVLFYLIDFVLGVIDMWMYMMGIVKVFLLMFDVVIFCRDWGDIRYLDLYIFRINDIVVCNLVFYNVIELGVGWLVYCCLDVFDIGMCLIVFLIDKDECFKLGGKWIFFVRLMILFEG